MVQNCLMLGHLIIHFPICSGVGKQINERNAQVKKAVSSRQISKQYE